MTRLRRQPTGPRWVVLCPDYPEPVLARRSPESAQRAVESIERLGACGGPHQIEYRGG